MYSYLLQQKCFSKKKGKTNENLRVFFVTAGPSDAVRCFTAAGFVYASHVTKSEDKERNSKSGFSLHSRHSMLLYDFLCCFVYSPRMSNAVTAESASTQYRCNLQKCIRFKIQRRNLLIYGFDRTRMHACWKVPCLRLALCVPLNSRCQKSFVATKSDSCAASKQTSDNRRHTHWIYHSPVSRCFFFQLTT